MRTVIRATRYPNRNLTFSRFRRLKGLYQPERSSTADRKEKGNEHFSRCGVTSEVCGGVMRNATPSINILQLLTFSTSLSHFTPFTSYLPTYIITPRDFRCLQTLWFTFSPTTSTKTITHTHTFLILFKTNTTRFSILAVTFFFRIIAIRGTGNGSTFYSSGYGWRGIPI